MNEKTNIEKKGRQDGERVSRGGSWFTVARGSRVSYRNWGEASNRSIYRSFRLVLQEKEKK